MTRAERDKIAIKRIGNVLAKQLVCNDRTLEQKIADAGPNDQRVDPHILTTIRTLLVNVGAVKSEKHNGAPWFFLTKTNPEDVKKKLETILPIFEKTQQGGFLVRAGQALEIAVYRALAGAGHQFLGQFIDLEEHGDDQIYKKVEPPLSVSGKTIKTGPLDFIVFGEGGPAGIEAKNIRQWLYPQRSEFKQLLSKCCDIDAVPVLIARRFPWVTFRLLNLSGGVVHQAYNQLYPSADSELAKAASQKDLLGYHDIRVGNEPDKRLVNFIGMLPKLVGEARVSWAVYRGGRSPTEPGLNVSVNRVPKAEGDRSS